MVICYNMIRTIDTLPFLTVKTKDDRESYSLRSHSHREVSLGYIRSGETTITVDGQDFLLREGDMVIIASGTVHLCTPRDRDAFRFDMLYFDRDWWRVTLAQPAEGFPTLALPASPELKGLLFRLAEDSDGSLPDEKQIRTVIRKIGDTFLPEDDRGLHEEDRLEAIHRNICQLPHITGNIGELAEQAGMGKFTFIRRYAARYGLTPHADVINMRIQRALLLFESEMSLTEIAGECGFSDQSHFNHQFKLYTGVTPREYRQGGRP